MAARRAVVQGDAIAAQVLALGHDGEGVVLVDAVHVAEVVVEVRARLGDDLEVLVGEQGAVELVAVVLVVEIPRRERDGGLERVLDLSSVPPPRQFLLAGGPVGLRELQDPFLVYVDIEPAALDALEIHVPYFEGRFMVESGVVETDVDAGLEGLVEFADTVGGEDQDARVVL